MFVPTGLYPLYPMSIPPDPLVGSPLPAISGAGSAGYCLLCVVKRTGRHLCSAAWAYYVVTLLPVIGIVQVGMQAAADRYTYLPGISIFLLAGLGIILVWDGASRQRYESLKKALFCYCCSAFCHYLECLPYDRLASAYSGEPVEICGCTCAGQGPLAYNNLGNAWLERET